LQHCSWKTGVRFPAEDGNFSIRYRIQTGSVARPASYLWVSGALPLGIKRSGGEANHSPQSSAEVNNAWNAVSPLPQYDFMGWYLVKHKDNFTFTSHKVQIQ